MRTTGNLFNFTPWYPGWLDGIPAYTYYFVLPDVLATFASYVIGFAVAMKLTTILGSVLMPVAAYAMGRLFKAPRPMPVALALATLPFLFDASFTIDGGNLFSTMAGEYAFSLVPGARRCSRSDSSPAACVRAGGTGCARLALSATLASHVLPWLFTSAPLPCWSIFELASRRGLGDPRDRELVRGDHSRPVRFAVGAGLISLGLSAWWLFPFATTQSLSTRLATRTISRPLHADLTTMAGSTRRGGAAGDRWVIVLAAWRCWWRSPCAIASAWCSAR